MAVIRKHDIIGFIKFDDKIGLYRADYDAWLLDIGTYCAIHRQDLSAYAKRKDGRFQKRLQRPIRKDDVGALVEWFDKNAAIKPSDVTSQLDRLKWRSLDEQYDGNLSVVLYDFDERKAFENPDLNPFEPFDEYMPEGWEYIVVEGFDALVPDIYVYWSAFESRLNPRDA